MKRILFTLALFTAAGLQAQDWGGGWGSTPEPAAKGGKTPASPSAPAPSEATGEPKKELK